MAILTSAWRWIGRNIFFIGLFLFAFGLVYVLFPKQGANKLEFQKGLPWRHKNLIAPFDFPILKTSEIIDKERDSLKKQFIPYLILDSLVAENNVGLFLNDADRLYNSGAFQGTFSANEFSEAKQLFIKCLLSCYSKGIVNDDNKTALQPFVKKQLYIVSNNYASLSHPDSIYSLKSAYVKLVGMLSAMQEGSPLLAELQQKLNLASYIGPNLRYDEKFNGNMLNEQLSLLSVTRGVVMAGERIITEGDIVNNHNYILLESLQQAYKKNSMYGGWISNEIIGKMVLVLVLMFVLFFYLETFSRGYGQRNKNLAFVLANVLITFMLARLFYENPTLNFYIVPVCILPIVIRTFMGIRVSIFVYLITLLLIGFMAPNSFEYVFIQLIVGSMVVLTLDKVHRRGHLVFSSLIAIVTYIITYFAFELIKEGAFKLIDFYQIRWFVFSGVLILISYPLIFIFEKLFGFVSDVTLMELSDTNHPLLRRLAEEAPGTFQHSIQVANLAEAFILHTSGNPMLVRAGALYHDVGKIINPHFFIENQMGGPNPHESMTNYQSASIIINHVNEGIILAKKYKIPSVIVDFIKMHHGQSLARYFYLKEKDKSLVTDLDVEKFRYPGPNPLTRETAVLMLADSVEAATRSLSEKTDEKIKETIDMIIDFKVENHELDDAPITFNDIKQMKQIFLRKLINIYHIRIQYPVNDFIRK
ncbi:MAG: HDIG domain-containing protein [Bacteroidales bacterium]|nr:HDIG domain-containing protein [Bacteroidales bacterium]